MALERLFPSMFQRRLLLLACLLCAPIVPLVAQVSRLTVLKHDELKAQAEARLVRRQWTATNRGAILDRKGRLLAIDKPSYAVLVEYEVLTGNWANRQATSAAQRSAGDGWYAMTAAQRESLVGEFRQVFRLHLENSWDELALRAASHERCSTPTATACSRRSMHVTRPCRRAGDRRKSTTPGPAASP